jgi:hypothetical protein
LPLHALVAARLPRDVVACAAVVSGAGACWAAALRGADLGRLSGYGLLTVLPPIYFVGLGILACGFAVAAAQERVRTGILAAHVIALLAMLHATTAILYPEPRYTWTYKHVGVIDYIATHGDVHRWVDIYQNWPMSFALGAWLSSTAGISPLAYAPWAQLFFELANVAVVVFAVAGVTRDARLRWTAAWLFVVANWIGQDYLAPQAFSFTLAVAVVGLVLRFHTPAGARRTRGGRALESLVDRARAGALRGRPPREEAAAAAPLGARTAVAVGGLCALAVVLSHQLSPLMLIAGLAALALLTGRPPPWVVCALVALEVWWVALSLGFVSRHFLLVDIGSSGQARTQSYHHALPGVELGVYAPKLSLAVMVLLALVGVVRRLRARWWDLTPALLVVAPFTVAAVQSYGGEAPLRAYLFALPWLGFFAAAACAPAPRARTTAGRTWRLVVATGIVGAGTLFGYFGQETANYVTPDDVAASRWYLDNALPGAPLVLVAPNFPERVDARYADHLDSPGILVEEPGVAGGRLRSRGIRTLESMLRRHAPPQRFVIVSPSQDNYVRYYGLAPPGAVAGLTRALLASPDFTLAYRRGSAYVFRFAPRAASTRGPTSVFSSRPPAPAGTASTRASARAPAVVPAAQHGRRAIPRAR